MVIPDNQVRQLTNIHTKAIDQLWKLEQTNDENSPYGKQVQEFEKSLMKTINIATEG